MYRQFLRQHEFSSTEDFNENLEFIVPDDFNFAYDVVDRWAEEWPEGVAIIWTNDEGAEKIVTFVELKEQTDKVAGYFASLGIGKGDMVMLILKRRLEWWLSMLALCKIGAVAIPATHMLTERDLIYRNNSADIKAIICVGDEYVLKSIQKSLPNSPTLKTLVSIGPTVPAGFHDWHKELPQAKAWTRGERNSKDDTLLMYFTSGTNGEPKMVRHSHTYALGHIITGVYWHNLHRGSIHLTVADTGWGKAVWGKMYGQWFAGATVFIYDYKKFAAADILKMIEKYRVTSFCAPPTVYRFMIQEDFSKYDISSLQYVCTAGEALNPNVFQKFYDLTGLRLKEGFGQTETTMTIGTMPWMEARPGSMGKPNPQYDIDIIRPDGTSCDDNEKGELVIYTHKGIPLGLFQDYYRDEALTKKTWSDGVYHTGDVVWRDEDGYYWFDSRVDDVIKSSGYRIGPFEVESALMTHPAVVECAVTGVPDEIRTMVVKATVVLAEGWADRADDSLVKELQEHVKTQTAPYKYPRIVEFVKELPKTISGKIRRVEIRENDRK